MFRISGIHFFTTGGLGDKIQEGDVLAEVYHREIIRLDVFVISENPPDFAPYTKIFLDYFLDI